WASETLHPQKRHGGPISFSHCSKFSRNPKAGLGVWNEHGVAPGTFDKVSSSRTNKRRLRLTNYHVPSVYGNVEMEHHEWINVFALKFPLMLRVFRQTDLAQAGFVAGPSSDYIPLAH